MTIAGLKIAKDVSIDRFADIQARTKEQSIRRTIAGEDDFHYKFLLMKSRPYLIYYMGNMDLLNQPIL
jgi:hypothetical protein